jgi:hypothetical protein
LTRPAPCDIFLGGCATPSRPRPHYPEITLTDLDSLKRERKDKWTTIKLPFQPFLL